MHTSILKLVYIHNEPLHALANHVAIRRNIKRKGEILYILYTLNVSKLCILQGGSNMTGTDFCINIHNQSRSYLNHLVYS
jgi:hypothetical protein